jgi:ectoine hydroxylase-related dioxygenase (phytanoyl-CoA dioxygenase family)
MLGPERFAPKLRQSEFYRNARTIARQILGPEASLKQSHSIMKPARSGAATPWHQDEAFGDPTLDYHEISFWLALQPVDRQNSCMRFIPGSHKWPIVPHVSPGGDNRVHALDCSAAIDDSQAVDGILPAGGCTLHTTKTVHGAGPNDSDDARWAYILVFGIPATPHAGERSYPWQDGKETGRQKRRKAWLSRGGLFVVAWRKLRQGLGI